MDWLKLTRTHPDLACNDLSSFFLNAFDVLHDEWDNISVQAWRESRAGSLYISMDEVKKNKSGYSMWTVLKGCFAL